jgi:hypothetical protein
LTNGGQPAAGFSSIFLTSVDHWCTSLRPSRAADALR